MSCLLSERGHRPTQPAWYLFLEIDSHNDRWTRSTGRIWRHRIGEISNLYCLLLLLFLWRLAATSGTAAVVAASTSREFADQAAAGFTALLGLLLLRILESAPVDGIEHAALHQKGDDDDEQDGEEVGLVVEDGHGLVGGADFLEPVELAHFCGYLYQKIDGLFLM